MKFLAIVAAMFFSSNIWAMNPLCTQSCSAQCIEQAQSTVALGQQVLDGCGVKTGSDRAETIKACSNNFGGSDRLACAQSAKSADVVNACCDNFGGSDRLTCAKIAWDADAVKACVNDFGGSDRLTCSLSARSAEQVKTCSDSFGGSDRLNCITGSH